MPDPALRPTWRENLALLLVLVAAGGLHLVRPNRAAHFHTTPLAGPLAYAFNVDSPAYARIVVRFPEGFVDCEQGRTRLLRPLYPALAWVAWLPLQAAAPLVPQGLADRVIEGAARANHPEIWRGVDGRSLVIAWGALVAVSVGLHALALWLVLVALLAHFPRRTALLLTLLPAVHFNTIDSVLVPNAEAFNLLIPALFLVCACRSWPAGGAGLPAAAGLGLALLGKGIVHPLANWILELAWVRGWRGQGRRLAAATALVLAPTGLYAAALAWAGLPLYNHEVEHYRQVAWIADLWREGRGVEIPIQLAKGLGFHLIALLRGFPVVCALLPLLLVRRRVRALSLPPALVRHLAVYAVGCAAFWCVVGYHPVRLSIGQYPALVVALGALASSRAVRTDLVLGAAVALGAATHTLGLYAYP